MIISHRGHSKEVENTIPAFKRALKEGYDGIELDVRLTLDGKLVCFHDEATDRLSNVSEKISECTLAELQAIKLFPNHWIPSLQEALIAIPKEKLLIIDLKIDTLPTHVYYNILYAIPSRKNLGLVSENTDLLICAAELGFKTFLTTLDLPDPKTLAKKLADYKISGPSIIENDKVDSEYIWLLKYWGCENFCVWDVEENRVEKYKNLGAFAIIKD